jgi:hypothetical protein
MFISSRFRVAQLYPEALGLSNSFACFYEPLSVDGGCSLFCCRRSFDQFVLVSGTGSMTKFYLYLFFRNNHFVVLVGRSSREDRLQRRAVTNRPGSRRTLDHILLSSLRLLFSLSVA